MLVGKEFDSSSSSSLMINRCNTTPPASISTIMKSPYKSALANVPPLQVRRTTPVHHLASPEGMGSVNLEEKLGYQTEQNAACECQGLVLSLHADVAILSHNLTELTRTNQQIIQQHQSEIYALKICHEEELAHLRSELENAQLQTSLVACELDYCEKRCTDLAQSLSDMKELVKTYDESTLSAVTTNLPPNPFGPIETCRSNSSPGEAEIDETEAEKEPVCVNPEQPLCDLPLVEHGQSYGGKLTALEQEVLEVLAGAPRDRLCAIQPRCRSPSEYLRQFQPYIVEDARYELASEISALCDRDAPSPKTPVVSTVVYHCAPLPVPQAPEQTTSKRKRKRKAAEEAAAAAAEVSEDDDEIKRITLSCLRARLPKLDYAMSRMVILIRLPATPGRDRNRNRDSYPYVLGIADGESNDDDDNILGVCGLGSKEKNPVVRIKVQLLAEAFSALAMTPSVEWFPLDSLTTANRMYEACSGLTVPALIQDINRCAPKPWPATAAPSAERELRLDYLNNLQKSVVNRMCSALMGSGVYSLIGPPGTGKTFTIAHLLVERVCSFPTQKILLTAPSNKAVQVVLEELLRRVNSPPMVACLSSTKAQLSGREGVCVSRCVTDLVEPFLALKEGPIHKMRAHLEKACETSISTLQYLLERPGLAVKPGLTTSVQQLVDELIEFIEIGNGLCLPKKVLSLRMDIVNAIRNASHTLKQFILQKAHIVFATLATSGSNALSSMVQHFDCVIVDEAAQSLIPETLIPLQYNPSLCLLIGDPQQLPGLVRSPALRRLGYEASLMGVLTEGQQRPHLERLATQYRMCPSICKWPSDQFYQGELVAARSLLSRPTPLALLPKALTQLCPPSTFIDCAFEEGRGGNGQISNKKEAEVVMAVAKCLLKSGIRPEQIGIITFYSAQVRHLIDLRAQLARELPQVQSLGDRLAISTVDGFQGDERDFTLVSCVRTVPAVGFLADHRRINVALSRARHARWVFGHADMLLRSRSALSGLLSWIHSTASNCGEPPSKVVLCKEVLSAVVKLK